MKFSAFLTIISLTLFLGFGFVALTLFSIYSPDWQNEYNKCLQRNDILAVNCINEKKAKMVAIQFFVQKWLNW